MDYTQRYVYNLPGLIFNSLSRNFLVKTLHKSNFGASFVKGVRTFYTFISSCVMSQFNFNFSLFSWKRGYTQGDPLSSYLFILALEPLLASIKRTKSRRQRFGSGGQRIKRKCLFFAIKNLIIDRYGNTLSAEGFFCGKSFSM